MIGDKCPRAAATAGGVAQEERTLMDAPKATADTRKPAQDGYAGRLPPRRRQLRRHHASEWQAAQAHRRDL